MSVDAFKDLTPVCQSLMLVLFVEIAYFSIMFYWNCIVHCFLVVMLI